MIDPVPSLVASACSADPGQAAVALARDPADAGRDLAVACVAGDAAAVTAWIARAGIAAAGEPTGPFGWPPIAYACFTRLPRLEPARAVGVRAIVAALLAAGADPNASFTQTLDDDPWRWVPLFGAAGIQNDAELTRMLLTAGADPNDGDEAHSVGEALYHACEFEDPSCARRLIDGGTSAHTVDYCLGRVLNFPRHAMVQAFCDAGAHASADHLHQAVWRRRPAQTVAALLDAGAPADAPDERGVTPLQIAVRWGEDDVAALLRERGADPARVTDADRTLALPAGELDELLEVAIPQGDLRWVRRLLDAGARVDGKPGREHPPLADACWRGQPAIARELIARGAGLTFPGGGSALGAARHGARNCQHPEGGPTMQIVQEIDQAPYDELIDFLQARV